MRAVSKNQTLLLKPRWHARRTNNCFPTEDHHETRGKVANTTTPFRVHRRTRDALQLPILHPDVRRVGRRYLGHVFLVQLLAHLTENQCETEGSGDIQSGSGNAYPGKCGDRPKGVIIESDYGGRGRHERGHRVGLATSCLLDRSARQRSNGGGSRCCYNYSTRRVQFFRSQPVLCETLMWKTDAKELLDSTDVPDPTDFPPASTAPGLRALDSTLRCNICQELYEAPVVLTCGHCFCSLVRVTVPI